ncbi:acetolactate synthase [Vulcanimicrobium alpinum]|uniref:Acetolactate synthase n=1 Tax=Vulcanimicrobium alpinum TaxID=3016050 RepID=A0AAN1XYJ7_UNVUL|nr:biosynthetic-type acetolactate synthase large subunit [Vulcanimicrobium alpinum]BDE07729.1 acetolactate synthase [Vulcanimicrobium alpinum]
MNGAQAVVATLEAEGVEVIFGYPGGAIMPMYDALFQHPVRHVLCRHEAAAAFAAGGYARTSGRVGVCCATSGPGATNLVTALLDAYMDSVPLVAITGQVRTELMGTDGFQEADVCAITQPITKQNFLVTRAEDIMPTLREAFALARSGRPGPVLVDIPNDMLKAQIGEIAVPPAPVVRRASRARASDEAVREAVARIRAARRPVAIIGGGVRAGAVEAYRTFVSLLGLPHASTIMALGAAAQSDPNALGMLGMHGLKAANKAVQRADLLIALGMRFDDRVTGKPDRFARNATVIHADIDATEFNKIISADVSLHGDLRDTLEALIAELVRGHVPRFDDWANEARLLGGPLPSDRVEAQVLSATDVLDRFFEALPREAIVTTDVGQHQMWAAQRARPAHPRNYATSAGLGAMGFGFPAAIGAQFANPEAPVFAIVGDGGFQMCLPELATLRRYRVPAKVLLIDNQNLGMVRQWQELFFSERYSATNLSDNPDFAAIARAYGIEAFFVNAPGDADAVIARFIAHPGPALLHAACHPTENVWPMIPAGMTVDDLMEARA